MSTTYSFKDSSGAFNHPLAGTFLFAGQIGMDQLVVTMKMDRTAQDVAADGNVMVSYLAGDNGSMSIQMQQTCALHAFLLDWFNVCKTAANSGDVTNWATATLTIQNLVDGSTHVATGVSPGKVPDKTYAAQGGKITWVLECADIQSVTLGVPGS